MKRIFLLFFIQLFYTGYSQAGNLSPLDYGLKEAKSGIERYYVLLRTHQEAIKQHRGVTYKGIQSIDISIPEGVGSIPLSDYTDFAGVVINVINNQKDIFLFSKEAALRDISLSMSQPVTYNYDDVTELREGVFLLCIEDQEPWVKNRSGYDYGATRQDILLIENGRSRNRTIQPYLNETSAPLFRYCRVTKKKKVMKNLVFNRMESSTFKTFLVKVSGQNNMQIKNIVLNTPNNNVLYADYAIKIQNSANIRVEDVTINGTYSQKNQYGYGISMNNVWNSWFVRVNANANWGVFGNNNVNTTHIEDCFINRFDVHCYGRDIYCDNTSFYDLYNQFSSIYGDLAFVNCKFYNFTPILMESSYNAYTYYLLTFKRCTFNLDQKHNHIVNLLNIPEADNKRAELRIKNLPNVNMSDCVVVLSDEIDEWYLFKHNNKRYSGTFDGISYIKINGLKVVNERNSKFDLFSAPLKTTNKVNVIISGNNSQLE